jgi:hypothetical protein
MKLEDLNVFPHFRGFRHEQLFENGWGVSIIPESDGIHYELAVLAHEERKKKQLSYTSTITNDVIRMCTVDAIDTLTDRIKNLPQRTLSLRQSIGLPGPAYD